MRSAWAVARRIDELLSRPTSARAEFRPTSPDELADLEAGDNVAVKSASALALPDRPPRPARGRRSSRCRAWRSPWRSRLRGGRSPCRCARVSAATSISHVQREPQVARPPPPVSRAARGEARPRRRTPSPRTAAPAPSAAAPPRRRRPRRRSRSSGTRSAGDRFISLRRLRHSPTTAFSLRDPGVGRRDRSSRAAPSGSGAVTMLCSTRRPAAGHRRDALPQLGGDERRDRMQQAQHRLEHADQRAPRRALLATRVAALQLHLGDLEVPVAVLVPDERSRSRWRRCRAGTRRSPAATAASTRCSSPRDPAVGLREASGSRGTAGRARTRPWCAPSGRSPGPRSSSARSGVAFQSLLQKLR